MSLKLAVNYRLVSQDKSQTGIPKFTQTLYEFLVEEGNIKIDLFSPNKNSLLNNVLFDSIGITKLASKNKVQILHGPANTLPMIKSKNLKYVLTVHDVAFKIMPELYNWKFLIYYSFIFEKSLKLADIIICDSHNTKNDLLRFYPWLSSGNIEVIYPGLDKDFVNKQTVDNVVNSKEKYFLSISTHPKRKNIEAVLNVISNNKKFFKEYKYIIVGKLENYYKNQLRKTISKLKIEDLVEVIGFVSKEELINLYRKAEFLIHPSLYEGFGFPVIEAAASKCLVITSNNSSLTELLPYHINTNFYIDPRGENSIFNAIQFVLQLDKKNKQKIIEVNYQYVVKTFDWHKTTKQYLSIFNQLART